MLGRRREGKEYEQEVRVSDSVRHAQAQGLARRIQSAAKLRTRHRAWCLNTNSQNIDFLMVRRQKILIFRVRKYKILNLNSPGTENIDF